MDADVLVVGAGPTGLMLANQLVRQGVRVMIVDRHGGPSVQTRALGVQARTLEIYAHLGIVERALDLGKPATAVNMWASGRKAARVPFVDVGHDLTPYPFVLILGQDDNERLLGNALRDSGVAIQWNTELVGLAQEADQVVAQLKQPDGTVRQVTTAWVGGCDGARSAVRELSQIPFRGAPYEDVFFVADTQLTGPMVPDEINVYVWSQGFHLFFPMRGTDHWRLVGIVPAALRGRDDLTFDEVIPSIRREAGSGLAFQSCSWFSTYRIHHRRAERFRDRRCFLLGDAAHIHSPVGAQGMNTGLQDAYNLGWKLALVVSGDAHEALLDSYESERIPIAERLLATTDAGFSLVVSESKFAGLFRTRLLPKVLALVMSFGKSREFAFRTISQTGIRYRRSPLSEALPGLPDAAPRAGDRFPWLRLKLSPNGAAEDLFRALDDRRFTLIVFGQSVPPGGMPELGDRLRTVVVPSDPANDRELERVHIPRPAFYLLRPDGHIGLSGARLDPAAVTGYVSERLGLRASSV
jgi:2-polyprenyl-6-methoxyphenol hydroxylase-like FAD-dependent oxidoreductase